MSWKPRVLLVAPSPLLARDLFAWLTAERYDVVLVTTFAAAKVQLDLGPHLLISEVRLGEYNGLHLASRAQARNIPSIVIGGDDPVLKRDARQMGVAYVSNDVDREFLVTLAGHLTADTRSREASIRRRPGHLAFVSSGELEIVPVPRPNRRFN